MGEDVEVLSQREIAPLETQTPRQGCSVSRYMNNSSLYENTHIYSIIRKLYVQKHKYINILIQK